MRDERVLSAFTLLSGLSLWLSLCRDQSQTVGLHFVAKVLSHKKKLLVVLVLNLMRVEVHVFILQLGRNGQTQTAQCLTPLSGHGLE